MSDGVERPPRARQLVLGLVAAVLVAAMVVIGIGRLAGFAHLRDAIDGADFKWLVICVGGQVAVFVGYAGSLRNAVSAHGGPQVDVAVSIQLVLASFAATQLFAFGGVGGLAIVYWALRRVGMEREESMVRVIGLSTAVYLVFAVIAWGGAAWALAGDRVPLGATVPWLVGVPVVLLVARWFTDPRRGARWDQSDPRPRRRALAIGVGAAAWVRRAVNERAGRPMFGWAVCYWLGDIASLWAALRAFGARPDLATLVVAYTTGYLAQSLPIPFIATGGVDAATTFLLRAFGVPLDVGLAAVVTHRLFAFWLPVLPGSAFAITLPRLGRRLGGKEA
jgi:uncharacterized membrane protein YbhN (UPF0104 family)